MNIYNFEVKTINGDVQSLSTYQNRALLIVNVASKCGYTPQYSGLESMYRKRSGRGFTVLGFPCDQFRHQEPGDEAAIKDFCSTTYDVTFPLFAKIDVNGKHAHRLYQFLKKARPGVLGTQNIKWNFTKFLVDKRGNVVRRYAPHVAPERIERDVDALL